MAKVVNRKTGKPKVSTPVARPVYGLPELVLLGCLLCGLAILGYVGYVWYRPAQAPSVVVRAADVAGRAEAQAQVAAARKLLFDAIEAQLMPSEEQWAEAGGLYKRATASDPGDAAAEMGVRLTAAVRLIGTGRRDAAVKNLTKVVAGPPEEALAAMVLGFENLKGGDPVNAWGEFKAALKFRPDWYAAKLGMSLADLESGDAKDCAMFESAYARWPELTQMTVWHARCIDLRNGVGESYPAYARAFAAGARQPDVIEGFVGHHIKTDELAPARAAIERAIEEEEERVDLRMQLARLMLAADETSRAVVQYRQVIAHDAGNFDAHVILGRLLMMNGSPELALEPLLAARKIAPRDSEVPLVLALAYAELERVPEMTSAFIDSCALGSMSGCSAACFLDERAACEALPADAAYAVASLKQQLYQQQRQLAQEAQAASYRDYYRQQRETYSYPSSQPKQQIFAVGRAKTRL